jgi:lysophospholipase L1-like esterase
MRKGGLYLAIGDSTVYNQPTNGDNLYANRVQKAIGDNYSPVKMINKGMSGMQSTNWLEPGLKRWGINVGKPDLVTIGLGLNDTHQTIGTTTFISNIGTLIDRIRKNNSNVHIILCTGNTIGTNSIISGGVDANVTPYRTAMDTIAANKNTIQSPVQVCHFETAWTVSQAGTYTADGTHPNDAGHGLLFNLIWPIVQQGAWLTKLG